MMKIDVPPSPRRVLQHESRVFRAFSKFNPLKLQFFAVLGGVWQQVAAEESER